MPKPLLTHLKTAESLRTLMKKYRISEQKLADEVQVSQKTISRYVTGEIRPKDEVLGRVLRGIATISGEHEADIIRSFQEISMNKSISENFVSAFEHTAHHLCGQFSQFSEQNQRYIIDHFMIFTRICSHEVMIVEKFHSLSNNRKKFLLENLELVRLPFSALQTRSFQREKIRYCLQMMDDCKQVEPFHALGPVSSHYPKTPLVSTFKNLVTSNISRVLMDSGMLQYLEQMVRFDINDWYLLMLVNMLGVTDYGFNTSVSGDIIGDKLFMLIQYLEKKTK